MCCCLVNQKVAQGGLSTSLYTSSDYDIAIPFGRDPQVAPPPIRHHNPRKQDTTSFYYQESPRYSAKSVTSSVNNIFDVQVVPRPTPRSIALARGSPPIEWLAEQCVRIGRTGGHDLMSVRLCLHKLSLDGIEGVSTKRLREGHAAWIVFVLRPWHAYPTVRNTFRFRNGRTMKHPYAH
jgi:hypothetical protein